MTGREMCANWRTASSVPSRWVTGVSSTSATCRRVWFLLLLLRIARPKDGLLGASTTDLEDIERATIQRVFEQVNGDKARAGKMLGISRATLYRKLKRYNIGGHGMGPASQALQ